MIHALVLNEHIIEDNMRLSNGRDCRIYLWPADEFSRFSSRPAPARAFSTPGLNLVHIYKPPLLPLISAIVFIRSVMRHSISLVFINHKYVPMACATQSPPAPG